MKAYRRRTGSRYWRLVLLKSQYLGRLIGHQKLPLLDPLSWQLQIVLVFVVLFGLHSAFSAEAPSPTAPSQQQVAVPNRASPFAETREALELQKLTAEVTKAERENKYFYLAYATPAIALLSGIAGLITILIQRGTAFRVQRETERANLEMKAAEFIFNSPTPTIEA
jgi:hypothetical protein